MPHEPEYLPNVPRDSRGAGFGFTKTDYKPDPGMTDMHLAVCAHIDPIRKRVGSVRWWVVSKMLHPESDMFRVSRVPTDGYDDYFVPDFDRLDRAERWPRSHGDRIGRSERLFTEAINQIGGILFRTSSP